MKKYLIHICLIFFLVVIGVGIINDINQVDSNKESVSSLEEKIENGEEINDGNLGNVLVEKEVTSNLISRVSAFFANVIVESLNFSLKLVVNLMNGITN